MNSDVEVLGEVELVGGVEGLVGLRDKHRPSVVLDGAGHDVAVAGTRQALEHLSWQGRCHGARHDMVVAGTRQPLEHL